MTVYVVISDGSTKYDEPRVEGVYVNRDKAEAVAFAVGGGRHGWVEESVLSEEVYADYAI